MGDATRINLYGVFARFKDSIARTIAGEAKGTAELANSTANTFKSEYEQFKTRNSISNNSKIISNWQTVFYVTDIDNVSMITTTLNPSVSLTGVSIVATITCIPISAETQSV